MTLGVYGATLMHNPRGRRHAHARRRVEGRERGSHRRGHGRSHGWIGLPERRARGPHLEDELDGLIEGAATDGERLAQVLEAHVREARPRENAADALGIAEREGARGVGRRRWG